MPQNPISVVDMAIWGDMTKPHHQEAFRHLDEQMRATERGRQILREVQEIWRSDVSVEPHKRDWDLMSKPHVLTSPFGVRSSGMHNGIDVSSAAGDVSIYSATSGIVSRAGGSLPNNSGDCYVGQSKCGGGWGNFVEVKTNLGDRIVLVRYCHLAQGSIPVREGQAVDIETVLGKEGNTGFSFGPHLHLEVQDANTNEYLNPIGTILDGDLELMSDRLPQVADWDKILADMTVTGASAVTASQDGFTEGGIEASNQMARTDWSRVQQFFGNFEAVASEMNIPVALLCAIASRESRGGAVLDNGWGDHFNGWGIMQVDKRSHVLQGTDSPSSVAHIRQATGILRDYRKQVRLKHPDWSDSHVLQGAVAAYNSGVSNVQTIQGMDIGTTGNDYSNDTIARAQLYQSLIGVQ